MTSKDGDYYGISVMEEDIYLRLKAERDEYMWQREKASQEAAEWRKAYDTIVGKMREALGYE